MNLKLKSLLKNNKGFIISGALIVKIVLVGGALFLGWEGGKEIGLIPKDNIIDGMFGATWVIVTQWIPMILDFFFNFTGKGFGLLPFIVNNFFIIILTAECFFIVLAMQEGKFIEKLICFGTYNVKMGQVLWTLIIGALHFAVSVVKLVKPSG